MTVQHHLDQTTIVRFASGDMDEAFAVVVAAHLDMCPTCRRAVEDAEAIGGQVLEDTGIEAMSDGSFDALLDKLDSATKTAVNPHMPSEDSASDVPKPLRRFIGSSLDKITWSFVAPGLRRHMISLDEQSGSSLYLLKIAAGKAVPEHGHNGSEVTLVLSGKYRDSLGVFGPGDIEDLDEHIEHQPVVEPDAPCICLVATEAPTRFKGVFSRMLQPLVGI